MHVQRGRPDRPARLRLRPGRAADLPAATGLTCANVPFRGPPLVGGGRCAQDVGMASGGFTKLPSGTVVVAIRLPHPACPEQAVRVVLHALNRQRAMTRLSNLGFRGARLTGNAEPPTPDEITAVLHHPDGLIWRDYHARPGEPWHPISTLNRVPHRP